MLCHGNLGNKYSVGTNRLIQDGAKLVVNANDIFLQFHEFNLRKRKNIKKIKTVGNNGVQNFQDIFSEVPITPDEIALKTKTPIKEVLQKITLLEIEGVIEKKVGMGYVVARN